MLPGGRGSSQPRRARRAVRDLQHDDVRVGRAQVPDSTFEQVEVRQFDCIMDGGDDQFLYHGPLTRANALVALVTDLPLTDRASSVIATFGIVRGEVHVVRQRLMDAVCAEEDERALLSRHTFPPGSATGVTPIPWTGLAVPRRSPGSKPASPRTAVLTQRRSPEHNSRDALPSNSLGSQQVAVPASSLASATGNASAIRTKGAWQDCLGRSSEHDRQTSISEDPNYGRSHYNSDALKDSL